MFSMIKRDLTPVLLEVILMGQKMKQVTFLCDSPCVRCPWSFRNGPNPLDNVTANCYLQKSQRERILPSMLTLLGKFAFSLDSCGDEWKWNVRELIVAEL